MFFSVIVPVYNRPEEMDELLESLTRQTYGHFQVLVVEDGSEKTCKAVVDRYSGRLEVDYFYKENSGQGFSRNYGFERAEGDYLVVFDSDCIIPPHYFEAVKQHLEATPADVWGGPDRSHPDFTPTQKAINYAMTSRFTTGGIRGSKTPVGDYHPRSFNMGISREVFEKTGGYKITRKGEDLEFSMRIIKQGYTVSYIEEAFVYHKRRTNFKQFFRQIHFFGRARIHLQNFHPDQLKLIHWLPTIALLYLIVSQASLLVSPAVWSILSVPILCYGLLIQNHSFYLNKSFIVSVLSVFASGVMIVAYGTGFLQELAAMSVGKSN